MGYKKSRCSKRNELNETLNDVHGLMHRSLIFAAFAMVSMAGLLLGQNNDETVSREDIEFFKKGFRKLENAFLGTLVEHQTIASLPPKKGIDDEYVLHWGKVKVEKVYRGHQTACQFFYVVWSEPVSDRTVAVSTPVQVPDDAILGKPMIWGCLNFERRGDSDIPLMLGSFDVMKPSILFKTVFEELEHEDKTAKIEPKR